MPNPPHGSAAVTIRPPATGTELDAFFQVAATHFVRDVPAEFAGPDFRRFVETAPGADPSHVRGAFRDGIYLGGYLIDERWLRVAGARLRAGCIGVVVTRPDYRGQGVATALMNDAFAYARDRGLVVLLLHGLANFYEPFGYVDVFDATDHCLNREDVLCHPASSYHVRPATVADADAMLVLYDRHFGPHPGSFVRSVAQQTFQMRFSASLDRRFYRTREGLPYAPPVVAVDARGSVRGYLFSPWGPLRAFGNEVAADDWPAALALLRHDAHRLGDHSEPPSELRWPLPPDGLTAMLLADHLTVRAETLHRPRTNWMAALVDPKRVLNAFRPIWEDRLRCAGWDDSSGLELGFDDTVVVRVHTTAHGEAGRSTEALPRIILPEQVLTPLLFGFRNARWAVAQPGTSVPDNLVTVLEILFPPLQPWVAATDGC